MEPIPPVIDCQVNILIPSIRSKSPIKDLPHVAIRELRADRGNERFSIGELSAGIGDLQTTETYDHSSWIS